MAFPGAPVLRPRAEELASIAARRAAMPASADFLQPRNGPVMQRCSPEQRHQSGLSMSRRRKASGTSSRLAWRPLGKAPPGAGLAKALLPTRIYRAAFANDRLLRLLRGRPEHHGVYRNAVRQPYRGEGRLGYVF